MTQTMERISLKEKIGYAMGDVGCGMMFSFIATFLQVFYTDGLFISPEKIMVIFIVARLWDAVNDPIIGAFIDSRPHGKYGKYNTYLRYFTIPLCVSIIFVFLKIPCLSENLYYIYAFITYIIFGMIFTLVSVPYGSLAIVMTDNPIDRSSLSIFRSVGSGLGGLPVSVILPMFVFVKVIDNNGQSIEVLNSNYLFIGVLTLSVVAAAGLLFCSKWTKERLVLEYKPRDLNQVKQTIKNLLKNRPFIVICLVSMLLITLDMFVKAQYIYLFKDYFKQPSLYSYVLIVSYAPMAFMLPFINKLIMKIGKKELCSFGLLVATIAHFILFLIKTTDPIVFLGFCLISGTGLIFILIEIWAFAGDVTDYQESLTGSRDEGTSYALFTFVRKLGHTSAGILATASLVLINYDPKKGAQSAESVARLYDLTTFIPFIVCLALFILLYFLYPLGKKEMDKVNEKRRLMRKEID